MRLYDLFEATTPLNIKDNDPGLLSLDLYLQMRNPEEKSHPAVYDTNLYKLNFQSFASPTSFDTNLTVDTVQKTLKEKYFINTNPKRNLLSIFLSDEKNPSGKLVGLIYHNVLYYDPIFIRDNILDKFDKSLFNKTEPVKYIKNKQQEIFNDLAKKDIEDNFHKPFKTIKQKGVYFSLRREKDDSMGSIGAFNKEGLKVASAQNEWGSTLVMVADEYKGYGLGPLLGSLYIDEYNLGSGGYTSEGKKNAIKIWNNRVSEFIRNGWYSELIKDNKITKEKVNEILSDFKSGMTVSNLPDAPSNIPNENIEKKYLIFIDENFTTFILYDEKFLEDQTEDYIYGYGHVTQALNVDHIFAFDYETDNERRMLMYIILQAMKDQSIDLVYDFTGSDYVNVKDLKYVKIEEKEDQQYIRLTKDILDLKSLMAYEKKLRKSKDQYDEIYNSLMEIAYSKWI